ncbi:MAG: zf-HC2 domain-containing protein [Planctomycetes bacterium]|nr:zf-HC2 domain-containing protein [Planctomycetota bacterium]
MPHCPQENLVSAYLDGELKGQDRERFKAHLTECPYCQSLVAQMMDIEDQLRSGMRPIDLQSGSDIASSVQQALSRTGEFSRVRRHKWWQRNSGSLNIFLLRVGILVLVLAVTIIAANRFTTIPQPHDTTTGTQTQPRLTPPATATPDEVLESVETLLADLVRSARTEPGAAKRFREWEASARIALRLGRLADAALDRRLHAGLFHLGTVLDEVAALKDDAQAAALAEQVEKAGLLNMVRGIRQQIRQEGM